MVAVSITNKSNKILNLTPSNLQITTSNGRSVPFIDIPTYTSVVKQNEIIYWYILFVLNIHPDDSNKNNNNTK